LRFSYLNDYPQISPIRFLLNLRDLRIVIFQLRRLNFWSRCGCAEEDSRFRGNDGMVRGNDEAELGEN
jgi:hypothetical protein